MFPPEAGECQSTLGVGGDGSLVLDVSLGEGRGLGKEIREGENTEGAQLEGPLPLPPPRLCSLFWSQLPQRKDPRSKSRATGPAEPFLPQAQRCSLLSLLPLHGTSMDTMRSARLFHVLVDFVPAVCRVWNHLMHKHESEFDPRTCKKRDTVACL